MTSQDPIPSQAALDIRARLRDPKWIQAAAQLEDEANCDISAGHDWGALLGQFMTAPEGFHQSSRLRALVLGELQHLLTECNLGAGLDAALELGQDRLLQRLQHPSSEIQSQLRTVLSEDLAKDSPDQPLSAAAQAMLNQAVRSALSAEDWEAISGAATAAIQLHFKHRLSLPTSA